MIYYIEGIELALGLFPGAVAHPSGDVMWQGKEIGDQNDLGLVTIPTIRCTVIEGAEIGEWEIDDKITIVFRYWEAYDNKPLLEAVFAIIDLPPAARDAVRRYLDARDHDYITEMLTQYINDGGR